MRIKAPQVVFHEACDNKDFYQWLEDVTLVVNEMLDAHPKTADRVSRMLADKPVRPEYPLNPLRKP